MSSGASIAVVGVVLSTAALVMVILIYAKPEVITGVKSEPEAEKKAAQPEEAMSERWTMGVGSRDKDMMGKYGERNEEGMAPRKVYTFAYENYEAPYNYLDAKGNLTGVMQDLVAEACKRAGQQCVHMYQGKAGTPCWDDVTERGIGLDRKYYDGCVTWSITRKRVNVFKFTTPLMDQSFYSIYTTDDSKTFGQLAEEKIGFVQGWAVGADCILQELKITIPEENVVFAVDLEDLKNKLTKGEISFAALPSMPTGMSEYKAIVSQLRCGKLGGYSIMMRQDSHIPMWFDKAFEEMKKDGTYKDICGGAEEKYGAAADCL